MKYFIQVDTDGKLTGLFQEHDDQVEHNDYIEVTPEQFAEIAEYQTDRRFINGEIVVYAPPTLTPEEKRGLMPPITKRQLRLTLVRNGISLLQVEQSIAAMPEGLEKQEAEIEWQDASQFNRLHPILLLVADALSLSPEQVDTMWDAAITA